VVSIGQKLSNDKLTVPIVPFLPTIIFGPSTS
jgi:hypothetical protein